MPHLDLPGAELYYETSGPASAPALLLIPAGIATLRMWDEHAETLSADRFVVRFDPRAFGGTRHDESAPFWNHRDAISLLDHLGVARATVIGASRGGAIAIDVALHAPDRVAGLVTVSARVGGHHEVPLDAATQARFDEVESVDPAVDAAGMLRLETDLFAIGAGRGAEAVDPAFLARARELALPNIAHALDDGDMRPLEPAAAGRLGEIGAPALVLVGEHDLAPFLVQFETLAASLPAATAHRLAGTAHLPSVERPGEFSRLLLAWLAEHGL
ncbi:alpha/beta fold hydrolase [Agromyces sp. NPDC058104]|uniref:alpha/beta fold hydrolase n=1 Tax=Agromyces sp. NPDC058104 TaxID=3346342 RepID=UPI0036DB81EB